MAQKDVFGVKDNLIASFLGAYLCRYGRHTFMNVLKHYILVTVSRLVGQLEQNALDLVDLITQVNADFDALFTTRHNVILSLLASSHINNFVLLSTAITYLRCIQTLLIVFCRCLLVRF